MLSNKYISTIASGFAAAVLSTIPEIQQLMFFFIVPVAAIFSLFLDQKIQKDESLIDFRKAFTFGIFTGLFAGIFSSVFHLLITFFTHTNFFVETLPEMIKILQDLSKNPEMKPVADQYIKLFNESASSIKESGFSAFYSFMVLFGYTLFDTCFGIIGGLIGRKYLNNKKTRK